MQIIKKTEKFQNYENVNFATQRSKLSCQPEFEFIHLEKTSFTVVCFAASVFFSDVIESV